MTNWISLSCLLSLSPWRLFDHFFVNINFWKSHQDKVELFKDEFVRSCWSELIHHVTKAEAQITFKGMWWCRLKLTLTDVVIHVQQEESFYISLDFDWLLRSWWCDVCGSAHLCGSTEPHYEAVCLSSPSAAGCWNTSDQYCNMKHLNRSIDQTKWSNIRFNNINITFLLLFVFLCMKLICWLDTSVRRCCSDEVKPR